MDNPGRWTTRADGQPLIGARDRFEESGCRRLPIESAYVARIASVAACLFQDFVPPRFAELIVDDPEPSCLVYHGPQKLERLWNEITCRRFLACVAWT